MGNWQSNIAEIDLTNKVVIVTGSSDGIGKEVARFFSSFNAKRVILAVRNMEKGQRAVNYIHSITHKNNCEAWNLDCAELDSVRAFAKKVVEEIGEVHVLVNNAAIGLSTLRATKDNLEEHFQVNYLAHFLLTNLLLETLQKSGDLADPAKVINVSSVLNNYGVIDYENINGKKSHKEAELYSNTKLMNIMFSNELNRRMAGKNVTSISVSPGAIRTKIAKDLFYVNIFISIFGESQEKGAYYVIYPALSSNVDSAGKYYARAQETRPNKLALDETAQKKLWEFSEGLLRGEIPETARLSPTDCV